MYQKTTSSILIGLSILLLVLNAQLIYLTYKTNSNLHDDAYVINAAGIVRGSIQRITKLELEGCGKTCEEINGKIDKYIADITVAANLDDKERNSSNQFAQQLIKLKTELARLRTLLATYKQNPTEQLKQKIISTSELCWEIADTAVLFAQMTTESKVSELKSFYSIVILIVLCNLTAIYFIYTTVRKKLEYNVAVDSLTGLYNRQFFEQSLEIEISRAQRFNRIFSLIYFDIDHFKRINDTYGHYAGDEVLIRIAELVKTSVRKTDMICRIGGEEFAIVSPETDRIAALELAEKIRLKVENHSFDSVKDLTISLGIAIFDNTCGKKDLIKRVDEALYTAKGNGRNRVECFG